MNRINKTKKTIDKIHNIPRAKLNKGKKVDPAIVDSLNAADKEIDGPISRYDSSNVEYAPNGVPLIIHELLHDAYAHRLNDSDRVILFNYAKRKMDKYPNAKKIAGTRINSPVSTFDDFLKCKSVKSLDDFLFREVIKNDDLKTFLSEDYFAYLVQFLFLSRKIGDAPKEYYPVFKKTIKRSYFSGK
jgi:hypothetical protein